MTHVNVKIRKQKRPNNEKTAANNSNTRPVFKVHAIQITPKF